jgi:voltage-gated potassium channel
MTFRKIVRTISSTLQLYGSILMLLLILLGLLALPFSLALKGTALPLDQLVVAVGLYMLGWMTMFVLTTDALSFIYDFQRPFLSVVPGVWMSRNDSRVRTPAGALITALVLFAMTTYAYAVIYVYVSRVWPDAFHPGQLDVVGAIYFTIITSATVGFGDIYPVSALARLIVASQVVLSFLFVILILSTASSLALRNRPPRPPS